MAYSEWKNVGGEIKFSTLTLACIYNDTSGYVRQKMSMPIDVADYSLFSCDGITITASYWTVSIINADTSAVLYTKTSGASYPAFTLDLSSANNIRIEIEATCTAVNQSVTMNNVVIS